MLVDTASQPDDLLIIGTGRRAGFGRMMRRSVSRYCLAHARCPVLAVPPSALMDEMSHPPALLAPPRTRSSPTPRTSRPQLPEPPADDARGASPCPARDDEAGRMGSVRNPIAAAWVMQGRFYHGFLNVSFGLA